MPINHQLKNPASPVELVTRAKTVEASRESLSLLTINGGSSSIRFALYAVVEPLRLDWLETQQVFVSVRAVGHRVVHGMTHTCVINLDSIRNATQET